MILLPATLVLVPRIKWTIKFIQQKKKKLKIEIWPVFFEIGGLHCWITMNHSSSFQVGRLAVLSSDETLCAIATSSYFQSAKCKVISIFVIEVMGHFDNFFCSEAI